MKTKFYLIFILSVNLFACVDNSKSFQLILTGEVTEIDTTGVTFNAKFINSTDEEITNYGFEWGIKGKDSSNVTLTSPIMNGLYSYRVNTYLERNIIYYAKAFVKKGNEIYYGSTVYFYSIDTRTPTISGFSPKIVYAGDTIIVKGDSFDDFPNDIHLSVVNPVNHLFEELTILYFDKKIIKAQIPYNMGYRNSIISLQTGKLTVNSIEKLNVQDTWTMMADKIVLNDNAKTLNSGLNGIYLNNNLYLRYSNEYGGLFQYNFNSKSVTNKSDYSCYSPSIMFSINQKGYLLFPTNTGCTNHLMEYDPVSDNWTEKSAFPGIMRDNGVSFVIGDNAYFGLGNSKESGYLSDFWMYNSKSNLWSRIADFPGGKRILAASFTYNNKGYIGFGINDSSIFNSSIWEYNPTTNEWKYFLDFPQLIHNDSYMFIHKNYLYIGRGTRLYVYNFLEGSWKRIGDNPYLIYSSSDYFTFLKDDSNYIAALIRNGNSEIINTFYLLKFNKNE